MPTPVRVIGRLDLAEPVASALRAAGLDAFHGTAGPMTAYRAAPPPGGVDVVLGTSPMDPPLWRLGRRLRATVPMVAVVERRREPTAPGSLLDRHGADAWATWPATGESLAAAVQRAVAEVGRPRRWSRADVGRAMAWVSLPLLNSFDPVVSIAPLTLGTGLLLSARSAWWPRWSLAGGACLLALGAAAAVARVALALGLR